MKATQLTTIATLAVEVKAGTVAVATFNTAIATAVSTATGTVVAPMAFAHITEQDAIFNVGGTIQFFLDGNITEQELATGLYEVYEAVAKGEATPMSEADVVRHESRKEIEQLKAQMAQVVSAQAVNTNTQTIQGGNEMNNQTIAMPTKETVLATYAAGGMTMEQMVVMLQAIEQGAQPQAQNNTVAQSVGNLVQGTTNAVGQLAVGTTNAVGQLLNSLMGVGTQAVNTVTGVAGNGQLKEKAVNVMDGVLDTSHTLVGNTINTGVAVGTQVVGITSNVTQSAIEVTANVANQLVKATEEIAGTLLTGLGQTAHLVNDQAYLTGKALIKTEPIMDNNGRSVEEILAALQAK